MGKTDRIILAVAAIALVMGASAALAADAKGSFALRGIGAQSCQAMTKNLAATPASGNELMSWIAGYLSAVNRGATGTFDSSPILDPATMANMVAQICRENPKYLVETATYNLIVAMAPARLKSDSPMMRLTLGKNATLIRKDTLIAMQAALVQGHFLNKKPDGVFDVSTQNALKAFQKTQKLSETGIPDPATVLRLLVSPRKK